MFLKEIYSIKLPGDPKLGEGKPENQNHAIIFTRGEAIQTIDMNQVILIVELVMVFSPFQLIYSLMLTCCLNDLLERGLSILLLLTFR